MNKSQIYVGKTSLNEDNFFELFDEKENEQKNGLLVSEFRQKMGLDFYDEDVAFVEFKKNSSLAFLKKYVSDVIDIKIPDKIAKFEHDIDFLVVIDTGEDDLNQPEKPFYVSNNITIKYLGVFDCYNV